MNLDGGGGCGQKYSGYSNTCMLNLIKIVHEKIICENRYV